MKKKMSLIIVIMAILLLSTACQSHIAEFSSTNELSDQKSQAEPSAPLPSGYPSGEIQKPYVFYQGTVYAYSLSAAISTIPEQAELIGKVTKVDNTAIPDEELEASRLEVGDSVYAVNDKLLVEQDRSVFLWFTPEPSPSAG